MKRLFILIFTVVLVFFVSPSAFAADTDATKSADTLHALGLFNGTGTDANGNPVYELDRAPTRTEAVVMLVRLLGKEADAKAGTWEIPFSDVAGWAKPYIGYAYANKLTNGVSATKFGSDQDATSSQYLTFALRSLGYSSDKDFQWDKASEFADQIGLTSGEYKSGGTGFSRGDIASISVNSLGTKSKDTDKTLFNKLKEENVIPVDAVLNTDLLSADTAAGDSLVKADVDRYQYYSYSSVGYLADSFRADGFTLKNIEAAATDDGYCFKISYQAAKSAKGQLFILGKQENDGKPEGYTFAIDSGKDAAYIPVSAEFVEDYYSLVMRINNPDGTYDTKNSFVLYSNFDTAVSPYRYIEYVDDTSTADGFTLYSLDVAESHDGYCFRMKYKSTYNRYVNFFTGGSQDGSNEAFSFPLMEGEGYVYRTVSKTFLENNKRLLMRVRNLDTYGEHNYIYIETNLGDMTEDYSKLTYNIGFDYFEMSDAVKGFKISDLSAAKADGGYVVRIKYNADSIKLVSLFPEGLQNENDGEIHFVMIGSGTGYKYIKVSVDFIEKENSLAMTVKDSDSADSPRSIFFICPSTEGYTDLAYRSLAYESRTANAGQFELNDLAVAETNDAYIIRMKYNSGFARTSVLFPAGAQGNNQAYRIILSGGSEYKYIKVSKSFFENENLLILRINDDSDGDSQNLIYIFPNGK